MRKTGLLGALLLACAVLLANPTAQAMAPPPVVTAPPATVEAAPETPQAEPAERPARVLIGAYINDINQIDLRNHAYVMDVYVWFRWTDPTIDPSLSFEFMNLAGEAIVDRNFLYPEGPVLQQGQFFYQLVRYQGPFSTKFDVGRYPFDDQELQLIIEDSDMGSDELVFEVESLAYNPAISLPGYRLSAPTLEVSNYPYATPFGDLEETDVTHYSRVTLATPITRPWVTGAVKTLLPVILIMLCAAAALMLGARTVEARIGLAITSLLALVALQFSMGGALPEVGYLLMLDQIYILSYLFVLFVIVVIVSEKRAADLAGDDPARAVYRNGVFDIGLVALYFVALAAIIALNLRYAVR